MPVRVDLLSVGTDENEPCENKPWNDEFGTGNNWNCFESTRQFHREALSSSRGQHGKKLRGDRQPKRRGEKLPNSISSSTVWLPRCGRVTIAVHYEVTAMEI
jgi:hypothetical protein